MNDPQTKSPLIEVKIEKTFDFIEKSWDDIVFTKLYHSVGVDLRCSFQRTSSYIFR